MGRFVGRRWPLAEAGRLFPTALWAEWQNKQLLQTLIRSIYATCAQQNATTMYALVRCGRLRHWTDYDSMTATCLHPIAFLSPTECVLKLRLSCSLATFQKSKLCPLLRMPSKINVPFSGMYCVVMSLMASCATIPPKSAAICGKTAPPARVLDN